MNEKPEWNLQNRIKSAVEVSGIYYEAAQLCYSDAKAWIGGIISRVDQWLCDYGDE